MEFLKAVSSQEALAIIDSFRADPVKETIGIDDALHRILAGDVVSPEDIPPFPRSLVDGFALKVKDIQGAKETNPSFLYIQGEIKIGEPADVELEDGKCVYLTTGAMIPEGADGVVMQEFVRTAGDAIEVTKTLHRGENICFQGEDIAKGRIVLQKGRKISAFDIGVLSVIGMSGVSVYKRPVAGIISTGDEIVSVEETPPFGKVRDINGHAIANILKGNGASCNFFGIGKDTVDSIAGKLQLTGECDLIILSGGSSKGQRDCIADAIARLGGEILFHGINIKPGKPTIFGRLWGKPVFGLPGHPNSCVMVTMRFVLPLLRRLKGEEGYRVKRMPGILSTNISSTNGVEEYVKVTIIEVDGDRYVSPIFSKSPVISSFVDAAGYIIVPEGRDGYEKDEKVEVVMFE
ncbi:MAG: molybdopterin molybdotransferase MoeA [Syntrophorhabdaceae bacterium]|nr:molybdopterin molybdotransferase MoeA [Syntrophorhabdaceae bacterium]MDD5243314.1 molybdopterin molybdotransferase MoeA [Syntrophorhabdaceae bacterium]